MTQLTVLSKNMDESLRKDPSQAIANRLPFDILEEIFKNYLLEETPDHPVETLLLICKSWLQAALESTRLWSTFRINRNPDFWVSCIPRRLARGRKDALLDIYIRVTSPSNSKKEWYEVEPEYLSILQSLTGSHGEVARRWHTFSLIDQYKALREGQKIGNCLSFSTPHLESFQLRGITLTCGIIPEAPVLKTFSALSVKGLAFPNLRTATFVRIRDCRNFSAALIDATQLKRLDVELDSREKLEGIYPNLRTLEISGSFGSESLTGFSAPSLRSLTLRSAWPGLLLILLDCSGLPLSRIEFLDLAIEHYAISPASYIGDLCRFLNAATSLRAFKLWGTLASALVLKLLVTDCQSLGQGWDLELDLQMGSKKYTLKAGEDRGPIVEEYLKEMIGEELCGSWEEAFSLLDRYLENP